MVSICLDDSVRVCVCVCAYMPYDVSSLRRQRLEVASSLTVAGCASRSDGQELHSL